MTSVSLVGSTGSIGTQAVEVVRAEPERYEIVALGAARSVERLAAQAREMRPGVVAIADEALAPALKDLVPVGTEVRAGIEALPSLAGEGDVVVNGVVGFAGLAVTLEALSQGRRLALANKESLIAGGPVVQAVRCTPGAEIVPVDSEHCAIHQCLRAGRPAEVASVVLTASGGPFRGRSREDLAAVSVEDALSHPTWKMGPKITVDSSTLMNKGLEVIEAVELFGPTHGVTIEQIRVVVHPQSIVHSMVTFTDGATMAQLSDPDMRLPIGYALGYPERSGSAFGAIDWSKLDHLDFEPPDLDSFRCLTLAFEAIRMGGVAPAWLNAANEEAVAAFLDGRIPWLAIAEVIERVLTAAPATIPDTVDAVLEADRQARARATSHIARLGDR